MKIVSTGSTYRIYGDDLLTYNNLPVKTYQLGFSKREGFFLEEAHNIAVSEKIYGDHTKKVEKIMNSFKAFTRNLGVILSGAKGIGKSVCAKLLAEKAITQGYPVILVNDYYPGIADYLASVEQEVLVIFDEFDKTFRDSENDSDGPQTEMLTLFDGMYSGKKMFVVTCNSLNKLNEFLVNRPGRFHYHLRFDYPTSEEIREYLKDKLSTDLYSEIEKVVTFAGKVQLNYDCLRAIAFELTHGEKFESAIKDLNIVNTESSEDTYSAIITLSDGTKGYCKKLYLDMWNDYDAEEKNIRFRFKNSDDCLYTTVDTTAARYDAEARTFIIDKENILESEWGEDDTEGKEEVAPVNIILQRIGPKNIHYAV